MLCFSAGVAAARATAARNRAAGLQTRYFTSIPAMGASVGRALKKTLSGPSSRTVFSQCFTTTCFTGCTCSALVLLLSSWHMHAHTGRASCGGAIGTDINLQKMCYDMCCATKARQRRRCRRTTRLRAPTAPSAAATSSCWSATAAAAASAAAAAATRSW